MSESQQAAAPESGDPEIEALLQFEPVPRKREVDGAWTPELQRDFAADKRAPCFLRSSQRH